MIGLDLPVARREGTSDGVPAIENPETRDGNGKTAVISIRTFTGNETEHLWIKCGPMSFCL